MTRILVITHGNLASELVKIAQSILEKTVAVTAVDLGSEDKGTELVRRVKEAIGPVEAQGRIIALTDVFGGTPSNLFLPFHQPGKLEMITGVNLGMLLHLLTTDLEGDLSQVCTQAKLAGQEAILVAGEYL
ncbi:MAG: hypothetical protein A2600_02970 [Candidatus Lambdaproteobacteria bacterium RIFOXYD1_FULL_56_27]|uniref:PTS EIIA type-4 domain-containing protein n=1 Tax=Candidatus Lambdaproteobacteria bacterium RIFOXYD2_FULL_56_26 TaxID=1817773 RepID=A0A1F6H362_9PROT|nr:MAG: hypothetical protein A2557_07035 [Candidatus Lambdaproteobacteria bacterium RIFOXYD2_FULL_56_26]OGH05357.1 MAG: hypothetical protein A2426_05360 [Candidatus Lambdaproteobacteria bacterium RIFOXYC1_FULL_56_13]OGH09199.1 MAG: hypothetical protein A2600_02970 [Candidatus Lambdaproteobacteria bacterium RIFOXYD1_FULL_56_27]